jgi:hypothetical protein
VLDPWETLRILIPSTCGMNTTLKQSTVFCAPFCIPRNNMKIVNTVMIQFKFLDIPQILLWVTQRGFRTCNNTNTKTNFHAIITNII